MITESSSVKSRVKLQCSSIFGKLCILIKEQLKINIGKRRVEVREKEKDQIDMQQDDISVKP